MMKKNSIKILEISALLVLLAAMALSLLSCANNEEAYGAEIVITVEVINKAGESVEHEIKTTATTLADALVEAKLVPDVKDKYGLYITEVSGEIADYSADKSYWALSKNGEYLMTGASQTKIADGEHYELTYTVDK